MMTRLLYLPQVLCPAILGTREKTCRTPLVIASRAEYTARQSAYQFYTYRTVLVTRDGT
ncbi:MAG: hypothetical protein UHC59_09725 [Fibrobacteraceae bacterium]|nr:hypothetical protein [Fibrobacteraceae bacterium]